MTLSNQTSRCICKCIRIFYKFALIDANDPNLDRVNIKVYPKSFNFDSFVLKMLSKNEILTQVKGYYYVINL